MEKSKVVCEQTLTEPDPESVIFTHPSELGDVALVVENRNLHANKGVLSVLSPVFQRMFYGDFKEKTQAEVSLPGKKFKHILELLLCIYPTTMRPISLQNVDILLPLADEYQISTLMRRCDQFLGPVFRTYDMKLTTTVHFLYLSDRYQLQSALLEGKKVAAYDWDFRKLQMEKEFRDMSSDTKLHIASSQMSMYSDCMNDMIREAEDNYITVRELTDEYETRGYPPYVSEEDIKRLRKFPSTLKKTFKPIRCLKPRPTCRRQ